MIIVLPERTLGTHVLTMTEISMEQVLRDKTAVTIPIINFDDNTYVLKCMTTEELPYLKSVFWEDIEKSPEHCKTKVKTIWKGKHCKPFYQTGRW
jgi:hypothetical protein